MGGGGGRWKGREVYYLVASVPFQKKTIPICQVPKSSVIKLRTEGYLKAVILMCKNIYMQTMSSVLYC